MKNVLVAIVALFTQLSLPAQQFSQFIQNQSGTTVMLSFTTIDGALINVSKQGDLVSYGIENPLRNVRSFPPKLDPYLGRIEYYSNYDDSVVRGKIKYLGQTPLTYYMSYDRQELQGKIKSIGPIVFTYYQQFEDKAFAGCISKAGRTEFSYFGSFDNEEMKGKFQSVGLTKLSYYSSFDDKAIKGKIKSIGNYNFTYYSSFDQTEFRGIMKSGFLDKFINGVTFRVFP